MMQDEMQDMIQDVWCVLDRALWACIHLRDGLAPRFPPIRDPRQREELGQAIVAIVEARDRLAGWRREEGKV